MSQRKGGLLMIMIADYDDDAAADDDDDILEGRSSCWTSFGIFGYLKMALRMP